MRGDETTVVICSRDWGVRGSLVMATISGAALIGRTGLWFSGGGVRVEVTYNSHDSVDVAIEIAPDAALGSRGLIIERDGAAAEAPNVFAVVAPVLSSNAGPLARGIGSHLL